MNTKLLGLWGFAAATIWGWTCPVTHSAPSTPTTLVGISVANKGAIVASEQAGKIISLPFADGDRVEKDQTILRLNSTLEELEVQRLHAIVDSDLAQRRAELNLEHALQQERRVRDLRDQEILSDADLQAQVLEVELARLKLKQATLEMGQARNQLAQAQERLMQRTVKSPFDGIVTARFKSEGESVERFAPVIEVMSLDPLWIEFDCPMQDTGNYAIGDPLTITPSFDPDDQRTGKIIHLSHKASAASHTFMIRAAVPNPDLTWRAGQKMRVGQSTGATTTPAAKPGK